MTDLAIQVEELEEECESLAAENEELRAMLDNVLDYDNLLYKMKLYGLWSDELADFFNDYDRYWA